MYKKGKGREKRKREGKGMKGNAESERKED